MIRRAQATAVVVAVIGMGIVMTLIPQWLFGAGQSRAHDLIRSVCAGCHRFEGTPESKFHLSAPDLMWGGSKYQRAWLIGWLTGKEAPLYVKGYRWDQEPRPATHMTVSPSEAEAIADHFEKHLVDPRVPVGAMDLSTFSAMDAEFGRRIYKDHACLGCHLIAEHGQVIGGPQSVSLVTAGTRYNPDWLYRFGQNPQDFTPHSGEFLADATAPQLRAVIGFLMTQGVKDFTYYEPWTSQEFKTADVDRGKVIYKEYCSQCHGATGKGDGPAASGLAPKPAIHADIPFEKLPMDYLYNVINHGGVAVGKSPNMPYWNLTIGQQGVADVMAYLKATFKGGKPVAKTAPGARASAGTCLQPRTTMQAPAEFLALTNPLPRTTETARAGEALFLKTAQPMTCALCHGEHGDGRGVMSAAMRPPPRDFTCGETMHTLPDGQLFWIIKNGSPGTGMPAFAGMPDEQAWQIIQYIRALAP